MNRYIHSAGIPAIVALLPVLQAAGAPLTAGRILVTTDQSANPADTLYEYTTAGVKSQSFAIPYPTTPRDTYPRDMAVTSTGQVQIFNGTFSPYLTTLDPLTSSVTHHTGDFSVAGNVTYGGVAVVNNYVFVPDMNTNNSANAGILRFDAANNYAATRFQSGTEYDRVSTGANGLLYAVKGVSGSGDTIDVFNPQSMALIQSVPVQGDSRAVAADPSGDLYVANWDGSVYHYTATGTLLAKRDLGFGNIDDIDISPTGQLVIGGRFGDVILTTTSLASQTSFQASGTPVFVAFTSPVPEPAGLSLLALGAATLLGRRRSAAQ